jgi:hypothetical protein
VPAVKSRAPRVLDFTGTGAGFISLTLRILIINPTVHFIKGALRVLDSIKEGGITVDTVAVDFRNKVIIILYNYRF